MCYLTLQNLHYYFVVVCWQASGRNTYAPHPGRASLTLHVATYVMHNASDEAGAFPENLNC